MNYTLNIDNRKDIVKKIEALTGLKSHYTMMPRCAYEIGVFTVEKDGSLTVMDDADQNVIDALLAEQMIIPADSDEDAPVETTTEPETAAEEDQPELTEQPDSGFPLNAKVSFPLTDHTVQSLTNLIRMITPTAHSSARRPAEHSAPMNPL